MKALLLAALALLIAAHTQAADLDLPTPPPQDWMKQADLFGRVVLVRGDRNDAVIAWEQTHQSVLSSGYLFDLSQRLLSSDPDQALEWYAVAMIRGQYDAGRCRDDTARRAVSRLSRQADDVNRYGHTHPQQFGQAGLRALARPDLLTHTISPDWVCAQGLTGMGGRSLGTNDPARWPQVEQRLRDDYGRQFRAMADRK